MTEKHYKAIAEIIDYQITMCMGRYAREKGIEIVAKELADYFVTENPRFDCDKFLKACGL